MTPKEAIEAYLGRPEDYTFEVDNYLGPNKGLINVIGLRHKGLIIAGNTLYHIIQEHSNVELDRWEFFHELTLWCTKYTRTNKYVQPVGANTIIRGAIKISNSRYFCVPAELGLFSKAG